MKFIWITFVLLVVGCGPPAPVANQDPPSPERQRMSWTRDASLQTQNGDLYDTYIASDTKTKREYMVVIGANSVSAISLAPER